MLKFPDEPGQTGLRRVKRKPSPTATGRLKPLRLFSTLPQNPAKIYDFRNCKATATANKRRKLVLTPVCNSWLSEGPPVPFLSDGAFQSRAGELGVT